MADPFSVEPPSWYVNMVGKPVDMTAVGAAVGGFLSRATHQGQLNSFEQLKRAKLAAQIEEIHARAATETTNNLLKQKTTQQNAEAQIETNAFLVENDSPEKILGTTYRGTNPVTRKNIADIQNQASRTLVGQTIKQRQTGLNVNLTALMKAGDQATQNRLAEIRQDVDKNGWTPDNEAAFGLVQADHNARNPSANKQFAPTPAERYKQSFDKAMDEGDTESAAYFKSMMNKAAHIAAKAATPYDAMPPEVKFELKNMMAAWHEAQFGFTDTGGKPHNPDPAKAKLLEESIRKTREKHGLGSSSETQPATTTATPEAAAPAANTTAAGVTIMVNPKTGQSVEVPQSEVERARKLGYQ